MVSAVAVLSPSDPQARLVGRLRQHRDLLWAAVCGIISMAFVLAVLFSLLLASDHLRRSDVVAQAISSGLADGTLAAREADGTITSGKGWPASTTTYYSECLVFSMLLRREQAGVSESLRSWIQWNAEPPYGMDDYCTFLAEVILIDQKYLWIPYQRYWHGYRLIYNIGLGYVSVFQLRVVVLGMLLAGSARLGSARLGLRPASRGRWGLVLPWPWCAAYG
jgi:hypothetical protein